MTNGPTYYTWMPAPVGRLLLTSDGEALIGLYIYQANHAPAIGEEWVEEPTAAPLPEAIRQLQEYFAGSRSEFDLPTRMIGTEFQKRVWDELVRIPYGRTISYGELALRIGNAKASRAVGLANGRNPISIIVPCHRVIGANGTLTGYGGGLPVKQKLLQLEGCQLVGIGGMFDGDEEVEVVPRR